MRPVRQIELDGDPLLNVRGNLYPIDLASEAFGFVHFNGYRFIRVYDAGGRKLWQAANRPAVCIATRSTATRWQCSTPTATAIRTSSIAGSRAARRC